MDFYGINVLDDITAEGAPDIGTSGSPFGTVYGESSSSTYGDLAERYTCSPDVVPEVGTVMEISAGDFETEICATELSKHVVGIISDAPGFEMNLQLENSITIGLVGRVPIRAIGPISKKDILVSAGNGCVRAAQNPIEEQYKVGIALEENLDNGEKLVLSFIK